MNKYFSVLTAFFFILLVSFNSLSAAEMNVTDYYKLCPEKFFGEKKPLLEFKKDYWATDVGMGQAIVDISNGYIECGYRGGGELRIQFVLYIKSDKTPVVAISEYFSDGIGPNPAKSSIAFYEYRNKEFRNVTSDILPEIDFRLYLDPGFDSSKLDKIKSFKIRDYIYYRYKLPQKGTTATAQILTGRLLKYLTEKNKSITPVEKELGEKFLNNINYNTGIELIWDGKKDKYVQGKKVKAIY